jgi:hypothetical protein
MRLKLKSAAQGLALALAVLTFVYLIEPGSFERIAAGLRALL